ncbi:MAG TPA: hypothetical protein RMH99_24970 [Sandaracinaceae bacterium LLY-WYZ-13_1]|nr:hypothetical protein [Sandaracinaceae bacterium LLY-WYZ-13_1]
MTDRFFDADATPTVVRIARPLIDAFTRSPRCPPAHRWHARSTLPLLALFVTMCHEPGPDGPDWARLDPEALLAASLEADPAELGFLQDLLDVSAAFYAFLADEGLVDSARAATLRRRLGRLAVGLRAA